MINFITTIQSFDHNGSRPNIQDRKIQLVLVTSDPPLALNMGQGHGNEHWYEQEKHWYEQVRH